MSLLFKKIIKKNVKQPVDGVNSYFLDINKNMQAFFWRDRISASIYFKAFLESIFCQAVNRIPIMPQLRNAHLKWWKWISCRLLCYVAYYYYYGYYIAWYDILIRQLYQNNMAWLVRKWLIIRVIMWRFHCSCSVRNIATVLKCCLAFGPLE